MKQLSALELAYVLKELKDLRDLHFNKFYWHGDTLFRLKLEKKQLFLYPPYGIGPLSQPLPEPKEHPFVRIVRKTLHNQKLKALGLWHFDRVLVLAFREHKLIVELMAKGNLILTDKDNTILAAWREHEWSNRTIKKGEKYHPPPNPFFPSRENLKAQDKYVIVAMKCFNLGTEYHREILRRAGIEERKNAQTLSETEINQIFQKTRELLSSLVPHISEGGNNFVLFEKPGWRRSSLEEALLRSILQQYFQQSSKTNEKIEKLKRRLEHQKAALEATEQEIKEAQAAADFAAQHIATIAYFIQKAKEVDIRQLEQTLKKEGFEVEVNKKERKLIWKV